MAETCPTCNGAGFVDATDLTASQNPNGLVVASVDECPDCGGHRVTATPTLCEGCRTPVDPDTAWRDSEGVRLCSDCERSHLAELRKEEG